MIYFYIDKSGNKFYIDKYTSYYHRLDGPAIIWNNNSWRSPKYEYCIYGVQYTKEKYIKYIQENHPEYFSKAFAEIVGNSNE